MKDSWMIADPKLTHDLLTADADEEFRETALTFQAKTHDVALKILKALGIGLGWDESIFDDVSSHGILGELACQYGCCCPVQKAFHCSAAGHANL
jgi:hypothetical protein